MKALLARYLSRKFVLTAFSVAGLISERAYVPAAGLVLGYVGVEGAADGLDRYRKAKAGDVQVDP